MKAAVVGDNSYPEIRQQHNPNFLTIGAKMGVLAKELPQEVLNDILSRVHIKDLSRFRCVSKSWLHLLSYDPHFNKLHFQHNTQPGIIALGLETPKLYYASDYTACDKAIVFDLPFNKLSSPPGDYAILGTCNGLICLSFSIYIYDLDGGFYEVVQVNVWNPFTGHYITIPCPNHMYKPAPDYSFEFGFDEINDEYKVIGLVWRTPNPHIIIHTLGTNSWRTLNEIPYDIIDTYSHVPLVNGALHWIANKVKLPSSEIIICFDVKDEVFQEITLPTSALDDDPISVRVGELNGLLSVFCMHGYQKVQIWVMKEYGVQQSWMKQCKFERAEVDFFPFNSFKPLCLASSEEIVMKTAPGDLILYNLKNSSTTQLNAFEEYFDSVFTFHGRLTSLQSYDGVKMLQKKEQ